MVGEQKIKGIRPKDFARSIVATAHGLPMDMEGVAGLRTMRVLYKTIAVHQPTIKITRNMIRRAIGAVHQEFFNGSGGALGMVHYLKMLVGEDRGKENLKIIVEEMARLVVNELENGVPFEHTSSLDVGAAIWLAKQVADDVKQFEPLMWTCGANLRGREMDAAFCDLRLNGTDKDSAFIEALANGINSRGGEADRLEKRMKEAGTWVERETTAETPTTPAEESGE